MRPCRFCGGDADEPNHRARCDGRQGALELNAEPLPIEAPITLDLPAPNLRGMVHGDDPYTSIEAALAVERRRTELHQRVLRAFSEHGPMTDGELEQLPEFAGYGPSTLRKRRSELSQQHALVAVGERRNERNCKMLVWDREKASA